MTTETGETQSHSAKKEDRPLFEATRRMLLASIGAVALAQDEIEEFINKLVERGELADKEGFSLVKEMKERRSKRMHKVEDELARHLDSALARMNMPTKADIDSLSEKIAALNRKIEELKQE